MNQVLSPTHREIPFNTQDQATMHCREPMPQRDDNSTMSQTHSEHPKPTSELVRPETVKTTIEVTSNLTSKANIVGGSRPWLFDLIEVSTPYHVKWTHGLNSLRPDDTNVFYWTRPRFAQAMTWRQRRASALQLTRSTLVQQNELI